MAWLGNALRIDSTMDSPVWSVSAVEFLVEVLRPHPVILCRLDNQGLVTVIVAGLVGGRQTV